MATHSSIFAWRTPWTVWKGKKIWGLRWETQVRRCPTCYWGRAKGNTNSSSKNEAAETKWEQHSIVDVSGGESKVWCWKEQFCIGTWNVRSMNQGNLDAVKQEMARVNMDILGISELKWTGMRKFNSDDHYIYYCGQESLRRNGVAFIISKTVWNAVLGYSFQKKKTE